MKSSQERNDLLKKIRHKYGGKYFDILHSVLRGAARERDFTSQRLVQRAFELADDFIIEYHDRLSVEEEKEE